MFIGQLRIPRCMPEFAKYFFAQSAYLCHARHAERIGPRILRHFVAWLSKDSQLDDSARAGFSGRGLQDR